MGQPLLVNLMQPHTIETHIEQSQMMPGADLQFIFIFINQ